MARLPLSLLLLLGLAAGTAQAQAWDPVVAPAANGSEPTVLPIWNHSSGRVEALLLLDVPTQERSPLERVISRAQPRPGSGVGLRLRGDGADRLELSIGLDAQPGMALLCDGGGSLLTSFGALADHCLLASTDRQDPLRAYTPVVRGGIGVERGDLRLDFGASAARIDPQTPLMLSAAGGGTPAWLGGGSLFPLDLYGAGQLELEGVGARGAYAFGTDGWVSIDGSMTRARLVPASEALAGPLDWTGSELSVGLGLGNFSGEITGRNVELPGAAPSWSGLDIGVSWRTPWQGKLTLGTQNVLTRGRNPWTADVEGSDESQRTPYVRYQQDL